MLEGENPAARIPMLHEDNKVEHYLDEAQLQRLLHVLRTDRNRPVCNVAMFLLSTGCRLNEVLSATWADVDIERRVFTVRATNSKSRRLRSVPLNDTAVEVLDGLGHQGGGRSAVHKQQPQRGAFTRSPRSMGSASGNSQGCRICVCMTFDTSSRAFS
jgi:integrase